MTSFAVALETDVPSLAIIARRLCGNPADADDLVQDTIERALRFGGRYDDRGNRLGWLATILRNCFRDRYRASRVRAVSTDDVDVIAAPEPTPPAAWEALDAEHIAQALDQLPAPFRRVYELHASGHAYVDIARQLDIPLNTVGTRLARARGKLKVILNANAGLC